MTELALIVCHGQGQVKGAQPRLESFVTWSRTGADFSRGQGEVHTGSNTTSDTESRTEQPLDYADGLDILHSQCLPTKEPPSNLPFSFSFFLLANLMAMKLEKASKPEWDMLFVLFRHLRGLPGWLNLPENAPRDFANDTIYLEHPEKKRLKQFQVERPKDVNCPTCFSFSWSASGCMNNGSC